MNAVEAEVVAGFRIFEDEIDGKQDELLPLLAAHREELATNKELMPFDPDFDRYIRMQKAGTLLVLFAYLGDELIGYSANIVAEHLHYRGLVHCHNDLLYVKPRHRDGRTGLALIAATKRKAKARGARMMTWHAKPDTALDALLPRLGCRVQDIVYSEEL